MEAEMKLLHIINLSRLILSLGAVQPSLCSVFVYHQETGDPVAHKYDWGCVSSGAYPSSYAASWKQSVTLFSVFPCRMLWWNSWEKSVILYLRATRRNVMILLPNMARRSSSSSYHLPHLTQSVLYCTCVCLRSRLFQVSHIFMMNKSRHHL